jgi:hypothetical protein
MYAVESIGDQNKLPTEEGLTDEVIQKVAKIFIMKHRTSPKF